MDFLFDTTSFYYIYTLFAVGIMTGFIGSMGGSGGLILVPFMIASGMPPALALGTARFAAIGAWVIAIKKYSQAGQVRWKQLPIIAFLAVVGGSIGTYVIIDIDEKYVYPIVGTILILLSPLGLLKPNFGLISKEIKGNKAILGYSLYFLALVYGGFFGAGASIMVMFVMVTFLGFRIFEAHATEMAAWIIMSVISSAIFIYYGQVNFLFALVILISMSIGSYTGSHFAVKGGDKWIKIFVCGFAFIMGVKLLFF